MKIGKKYTWCLLFLFILLLNSKVVVRAENNGNFVLTNYTDTSLTMEWKNPAGIPENYILGWSLSYNKVGETESQIIALGTRNSYTLTGLESATRYELSITGVYMLNIGSDTVTWSMTADTPYMNKLENLHQTKWWYYSNRCDVEVNEPGTACIYEFEVYDVDDNEIKKSTEAVGCCAFDVDNAKQYKVRVRSLMTQSGEGVHNGTKMYSMWSDWCWCIPQPMIKDKGITISNKGAMTIKWNKIAGVSKYKIWVSTKKKSGYKCVKTVSKKKSKVTISKFKGKKFNKKKKYYVYITADVKKDNTVISSAVNYTRTNKNKLYWMFD